MKSHRRNVSQILKKLGVETRNSDTEIKLNQQTNQKMSDQVSIVKSNSSSSSSIEMLPMILAIIDEIRDAICAVLSDEHLLRDELLQRIDAIAATAQEELSS